jgi:hypothetical protein
MNRLPQLSAARYFGHPDCTWWAVPQVLNFYHCRLPEYRDLRLVNQHPGLLYLLLQSWAKKQPKAVQQAGKHFWHSLSWKQRHAPLDRTLGQRILRAFRVDDSNLARLNDDKEVIDAAFYQDGDTVKSIQQGGFSYADDDGEGEQEYWTTVECGGCGLEWPIREQLGGDSAATFLLANAGELEGCGWLHLSGPYGRCNECGAVNRAKVYPADELPDAGWANVNEDGSEAWDDYQEHLDDLLGELKAHLVKHGLPEPDGLRLDIGHADWQGRDAWAECRFDGETLAKTMRVDSQFIISNGRLLCYPDGRAELRCSLSHHDVPQGSPVTVAPYWEDELSYQGEDHLSYEEVRGAQTGLANIAQVLLCGEAREFQYSANSTFKAVGSENLAGGIEWLAEQCAVRDLDAVTGYSLALGLLLERLADDVRTKRNVPAPHAQLVRDVLDHWLEHSTEEECK